MKKYCILLIFCIQYCCANSQLEISILTCAKGNQSYTSWGHSAIRVLDKNKSIDLVYNFGVFDFNSPNFLLDFIRGKLKYSLERCNYDKFINGYIYEKRQIIEQKLNLSNSQKVKIKAKLENFYQPENRFYYYSFVNNNCTTKLRDLLFDFIEIDNNDLNPITPRTLINKDLTNKQWLKFGINLILGYKMDNNMDSYERIFLPNSFYNKLKNLRVDDKKIVNNENRIGLNDINESKYLFLFDPILIFSIILLIAYFDKSENIKVIVFLLTGIAGLLLLFICLFTEYAELKSNANIMWCNPLYLILLFLHFYKYSKFQLYLAVFLQILLVGIAFIWIFQLQQGVYAFIPPILILSIYNIRLIRKIGKFIRHSI